MTDDEIVLALAEKVMGWHVGTQLVEHERDSWVHEREVWMGPGSSHGPIDEWDPLNNDADACAVLDKMHEEGYEPRLYSVNDRWVCKWFIEREIRYGDTMPTNRRRAICIAALKSVGAYTE